MAYRRPHPLDSSHEPSGKLLLSRGRRVFERWLLPRRRRSSLPRGARTGKMMWAGPPRLAVAAERACATKGAELDSSHPDGACPSQPRRRAPNVVLWGSLVLVGLGLVWTLWRGHPSAGARDRLADAWPTSPWKNARPDVKYVGDAACVRCHGEIAGTFGRHPMGRSLAPIESAPTVGDGRVEGMTTFEAGSSRFTV